MEKKANQSKNEPKNQKQAAGLSEAELNTIAGGGGSAAVDQKKEPLKPKHPITGQAQPKHK
jgi:hypothetical protein